MKKTLLLLFFYSQIYSQDYKKEKSVFKHSEEINSIATTNDFFATSSIDKSVIVWNYKGKIKINTKSCFILKKN